MEKPILFYSTNLMAAPLPFDQALLKGLAPDKGLYMPENIPLIDKKLIRSFKDMDYHAIAYEVSHPFLKGVIGDDELRFITTDAYNFEVPLEHVTGSRYVMRLDQGPSASFKDFAARMMGRLMQYYLKQNKRKLLILTATSGDTGSAIANAFYGLNNIEVAVLFPKTEVTNRQRKQMTTLGKNVKIISVEGKFDDCQALVKQAFADHDLDKMNLSSANSINIGRLIPQIVYYFYAYARLCKHGDERIIFSVPSGNFGDMMGGVLAMKMGLPVKRFIIATNENDEFPNYLQSGNYNKIVPSKNCISSAMNVGHPSNLARLVALYNGMMDESGKIFRAADMDLMQRELWSTSISDELTRETIRQAWKDHRLLLEPHGAVGWAGLEEYCRKHKNDCGPEQVCVSLETAHPAKFPEEINRLLKFDPELPPSLEGLEDKTESYDSIDNDYEAFKNYLTEHYN
ncbi:MAG: threonine synthase [Bacteroidales bacterium]|nr:threonine synthase [Bacteroidales bacterium]